MNHDSIDWQRFAECVGTARRILLTAHVRPDGDCIGSELAMAAALRQLGKEVCIVNADPVPPGLKFMPGTQEVEILADVSASEEAKKRLETMDLLLVLDTISWAQLGPMKQVLQTTQARKIALDHHAVGDDIGAEVFSDSHAEATGVLVFQAVKHLGCGITSEIAQTLFIAIATDTGWFRFASVTAETYEILAELIRAGAVPHVIYNQLHEQETLGKMRLIGRTLAKAELFLEGKLAFTSILDSDFREAGALPGDSEDIINQLLLIRGTEMAVIVVEQKTGGFKISFRSRCHVDCSQVAATFGGGGHRAAAGAFQNLPYDKLKQALTGAMTEAYRG
ncbi:MAG: DHH family phosphoesterase [Planctomycetaceae bacterium]|jgi:phosphoesterase RecJ-like protein|nr:DHH family phosphoesterase [Planctomycetaceae bacterium]